MTDTWDRITRPRARPCAGPPVLPRAEALVTVVVLALVAVHLVSPVSLLGDATYLAGVVLAAFLAWWAAARVPRDRRVVARLVAAGVSASALGDLVWLVIYWRDGQPDASLADVGYLTSYLLLAAALVLVVVVRREPGTRVDALVDALTIVTVSLLLLWSLTIEAIVGDDSAPAAVRAIWAAYPVADAVLLALVLRVLVSRSGRSHLGIAFAIGVGCWLFSDLGYLLFVPGGAVTALLDVGWMLGALFLALSIRWHRSRPARVRTPVSGLTGRGAAARLSLAVLPLLVPPLVDIREHRLDDGGSTAPIYAAMAVLVALTWARTARLLQSERTARATAARSERRYATLSANSSDAVVVLDAEGRLVDDSPDLARLLPHLAEVRAGQHWLDLVGTGDTASLRDAIAAAAAAPGSAVTAETNVAEDRGGQARSDQGRWLGIRVVDLLHDADVAGVVVAVSDISAAKRAEAELADARDAALEGSRAKSAFLATMSHEIRTPMNGVIGLTSLLRETELDPRQRSYVDGVHAAGDALLAVINDILDFSKVEAGHLDLEEIDFDLVQVLEEVAGLVWDRAREGGLELLAYCSPQLPPHLHGDPARLRQVLLNLAANAVKFTHDGEVVVSAHLESRTDDRVMVRLEVSDTGVGIDDDALPWIFEPFSQADSSTTRRYGGTGLGLAIADRLVRAMGGTMGVTSTVGVGSTFWCSVPLTLAHAPVPRPPDPGLAGTSVLVVDDNATNRLVLCEQVEAWGMRSLAVTSGHEALAALRDATAQGRPYPLAVLDMCMPQMDGLELAATISQDPQLAGVRMVLLTSGPDISTQQALRAGIVARLTKPVRLHDLRTALSEALADPADAPSGRGGARPRPAHRGHLLVVEDDETNQMVATGITRRLGFTIDIAGNGREALDAVARRHYDAVLMDCQMPVLDGYDATRELRAREGDGPRTPVIAVTASAVMGDRERCLAAGMDDYLSKPFDPSGLDAVLTRWVPGTGSRPDDQAAARP
ncbi:hybrid sensor histidine kinase/response regulator [Nocardioides salarius]|uniref:hybrid sensor histidine kinase/response regulator n=1 Tax=Nocardioides salarius TaxID=374513 RepID=UPI0030F7D2EE